MSNWWTLKAMLDSVLRAYIPSHAQGEGDTNVVPRIKPWVSYMQSNSLDDSSSSNLKKNHHQSFLSFAICKIRGPAQGTAPRAVTHAWHVETFDPGTAQ